MAALQGQGGEGGERVEGEAGEGGKEEDGPGLYLRSCQEAKQVQANNVGGANALYDPMEGSEEIRVSLGGKTWRDGGRSVTGRSGMR